MRISTILTSLLFVNIAGFCTASRGNVEPEFVACLDQCTITSCPSRLPFTLRLMQWDCPENCRYTCMQQITARALQDGTAVYQYYGKWPFTRLWGIQEPASVLASIGNGLVHYHYYQILRREIPNVYYMKPFMLVFSLIGMNAWVWSTVFHARDTPLTEKLDYFSAGLFILYSLYYAVIRLFHIKNRAVIRLLTVTIAGLFLAHVSYLSFYKFDYGYNMLASVIVGSLQLVAWVGWAVWQYLQRDNGTRKRYAYLVIVSVVGTAAAMSLELFDFAPWWQVFDAHSLWHFSTIPLMVLWYRFILLDTPTELRAMGKHA
ncbi:Per1-like protein [Dichotomocladium elegans]|nr:Per1-like protein [Dichotomocladium elegans]